MKPVLFFAAGIAVGLWTSLVTAQAPRSMAILNTPAVYIELLSPNGRDFLQAGKAFWLPGLTPHDIRNESNRPAKVYVVAMKRCD